MQYRDLDSHTQKNIQDKLESYWYQRFDINERDEYYSQSGMQYGYIAINERTHEILICDCTYDDGDHLIGILRY